MFCHPTGDGHSCTLKRSYWTGAAHVDGDRVAEVFDAKICGKMFGRSGERRGDDAVDVVRGEPGIGDSLHRGFEHQRQVSLARAAGESSLACTDDTSLIFECEHTTLLERMTAQIVHRGEADCKV